MRHDDPHRVPVVGRQRFSVHLISQDHVVQRLGHRDRPPHPPVADPGHDEARIKPGRHDGHRLAGDPRPLQDGGQRDAAPGRHPDRAEPPGCAGHRLALLGGEEAPAVACALDRADHRARRQVQQVLVAEPHRIARRDRTPQPGAEHAQAPGPGVDKGRRRVIAHEEIRVGHDMPLSPHDLPAHLGVGPVHAEPVRGQRLGDRAEAPRQDAPRQAVPWTGVPAGTSGQPVVEECRIVGSLAGRAEICQPVIVHAPPGLALRPSRPFSCCEHISIKSTVKVDLTRAVCGRHARGCAPGRLAGRQGSRAGTSRNSQQDRRWLGRSPSPFGIVDGLISRTERVSRLPRRPTAAPGEPARSAGSSRRRLLLGGRRRHVRAVGPRLSRAEGEKPGGQYREHHQRKPVPRFAALHP